MVISRFIVNTDSYEVIIPEEKDGIEIFLSSELFPGIGLKKARKIVETFGDKSIDIITKNPEKLSEIPTLTKKNIDILVSRLEEYSDSINIIIKLNEYGFNNKDSTSLYNKYKKNTLNVIENNIYDVIDLNMKFKKIDLLALKHNYDFLDKRRIKATIIYLFEEVINNIGDTYLLYVDIYDYLKRALEKDISFSLYEECMNELINESKLMTFNKIQKESIIIYNNEQQEAITNAFNNHFMIITGGPGTGKTTIIKGIIDLYKELHKKELDLENKIILLAPTGRASKRMMESISYPAQTIHRFLKWNKDDNSFGVNEYNKVKCDMVIIDEASMVDTYLLDALFKGIYYDTKVILVGDYDQLPSVGAGEVLKDLIESDKFNVIRLNELYRQQKNSNIITLAYDINDGLYNPTIFNKESDLTYIKCDSYNLAEVLSELCYNYKDLDYNDLMILAPMYKTVNGIDNLNMIIKEIFNPLINQNEIVIGDTKFREGDKVCLLVNMPDDGIYNGDTGIIVEIDNDKKEIYIDFDSNIVKFTKNNFYNFKLGFVMSIHKSQGSEYKVVIVIMLNEFRRMLYRKLLYTAVTRTKENLYILGEDEAIIRAINNNLQNERKTNLKNFINNMYENDPFS